jgi:hypothetical protein
MTRYLFQISGHMEIVAESLEEAREKVKDTCFTELDKRSNIFYLVVPGDTREPIHTEPAKR